MNVETVRRLTKGADPNREVIIRAESKGLTAWFDDRIIAFLFTRFLIERLIPFEYEHRGERSGGYHLFHLNMQYMKDEMSSFLRQHGGKYKIGTFILPKERVKPKKRGIRSRRASR